MNEGRRLIFSEREGHVKIKEIQTTRLDEAVRTRLWNVIASKFTVPTPADDEYFMFSEKFVDSLWIEFLAKPTDRVPESGYAADFVRELIMKSEWHRVFDLIEHILENWHSFAERKRKSGFIFLCNKALKKENAGYRIVGNVVTPIISDQELHSIGNAIHGPFQSAGEAIQKAYGFLSNRTKPDYENSIKESASAIESISTEITGENNFAKAVAKLKSRGVQIHPQFESALGNLFNFSSNLHGARHRTPGKPTSTTRKHLRADERTAMFMLVTCSAFVNYITAEHAKTKK